jgi:hypothetical protein
MWLKTYNRIGKISNYGTASEFGGIMTMEVGRWGVGVGGCAFVEGGANFAYRIGDMRSCSTKGGVIWV